MTNTHIQYTDKFDGDVFHGGITHIWKKNQWSDVMLHLQIMTSSNFQNCIVADTATASFQQIYILFTKQC